SPLWIFSFALRCSRKERSTGAIVAALDIFFRTALQPKRKIHSGDRRRFGYFLSHCVAAEKKDPQRRSSPLWIFSFALRCSRKERSTAAIVAALDIFFRTALQPKRKIHSGDRRRFGYFLSHCVAAEKKDPQRRSSPLWIFSFALRCSRKERSTAAIVAALDIFFRTALQPKRKIHSGDRRRFGYFLSHCVAAEKKDPQRRSSPLWIFSFALRCSRKERSTAAIVAALDIFFRTALQPKRKIHSGDRRRFGYFLSHCVAAEKKDPQRRSSPLWIFSFALRCSRKERSTAAIVAALDIFFRTALQPKRKIHSGDRRRFGYFLSHCVAAEKKDPQRRSSPLWIFSFALRCSRKERSTAAIVAALDIFFRTALQPKRKIHSGDRRRFGYFLSHCVAAEKKDPQRRSSPLWIFSFALRCSRKERSTAAIVAALDIFFRTALQPKRKIHSGDRRRFGYFLSHCVAAEKKDPQRRSSPLWIFSFALRCSRKERSTAAIVAALDIFFRTALQPKRKIHSGDRRRFGYFLSHCVAAEKKDPQRRSSPLWIFSFALRCSRKERSTAAIVAALDIFFRTALQPKRKIHSGDRRRFGYFLSHCVAAEKKDPQRRSSPLWIFSFALRCSRKERSTAAIVAALDIFFRTALQPKRKIHSGDRRRFGYFLSHCVAAEKKDPQRRSSPLWIFSFALRCSRKERSRQGAVAP